MTLSLRPRSIGTSLQRLDGRVKVTGTAPYAYEYEPRDATYLHPLQAAIARGRVASIDTGAAEAIEGVIAVLTRRNAPALADTSDGELAILQSDEVTFRGELIGAVVAETPEIAREAADLVHVEYEQDMHATELRADRDDLYKPDVVNGGFPPDSAAGDVDAALATAPVVVDETYTTPMQHNNPMEPHSCVAVWDAGNRPRLTLYDSTQGAHPERATLAPIFGLEPEDLRIISPYVGGGFGSKGPPHAHSVLAGMAAQLTGGRPVKLALTRQQMFSLAGHRAPTIAHVRLGAGTDGRLVAISDDVVTHTSRIKEFAEQAATPTRMMYAAPNRATSHRLASLDVPVPSWMRAPGVTPGMFGPEVAMDELAVRCGLDPIELRARNEPEVDPESQLPWSSRRLVECLRLGARRFGWGARGEPGTRRDGDRLVGLGVASSTYPLHYKSGSVAAIERRDHGRYRVLIGAADIGTGTWTALTQIAADALDCPTDAVELRIGDTDLPAATVEGGSSGIASWGSAVVAAAAAFCDEHGSDPPPGARTEAGTPDNPDLQRYAVHSFGAQFAEVRVDVDTGEVRVPRLLAVFSAGRIINPRTARSQFIGGMTMGLSMALHEHSVLDHRTGHVVNHDFAEYHIPTSADVHDIDAVWLDEQDPRANPMGAKGIGEIGIVGAAAAIANAVHNATGVRVRELPIMPDSLLHKLGP